MFKRSTSNEMEVTLNLRAIHHLRPSKEVNWYIWTTEKWFKYQSRGIFMKEIWWMES